MERQFTRQAENALKLAKTTAKSCGHGYIGTEHLLAGLLKEPEGTAGKVLQEFNVEEEKLMELINDLIAPSQGSTAVEEPKDPQYSPRSRRILEQAQEDAESMECLCGTEHLLLALLKEPECVATRLLFTMGVNIQKLFAAILTAMGFDNDTIAEEFQYAKNAKNKRTTRRFSFTVSGTIPITIRWASPSTIAVLPTPGSPTRHGLFLVRLLRIWISRVISFSRPTTGSSFPSAASCVRSRLYWSSVGVADPFCPFAFVF